MDTTKIDNTNEREGVYRIVSLYSRDSIAITSQGLLELATWIEENKATKDQADRRAHDAQRDHDADKIPEGNEGIERPVGVEIEGREAEIEVRGPERPGNPFSPPV